jgi:hypothetical protein
MRTTDPHKEPACSLLVGTAGGAPVTTSTTVSNTTDHIPENKISTDLDVKFKELC